MSYVIGNQKDSTPYKSRVRPHDITLIVVYLTLSTENNDYYIIIIIYIYIKYIIYYIIIIIIDVMIEFSIDIND